MVFRRWVGAVLGLKYDREVRGRSLSTFIGPTYARVNVGRLSTLPLRGLWHTKRPRNGQKLSRNGRNGRNGRKKFLRHPGPSSGRYHRSGGYTLAHPLGATGADAVGAPAGGARARRGVCPRNDRHAMCAVAGPLARATLTSKNALEQGRSGVHLCACVLGSRPITLLAFDANC